MFHATLSVDNNIQLLLQDYANATCLGVEYPKEYKWSEELEEIKEFESKRK